MTAIKHLWAEHRLALLAFVAALGALAYFGVTTLAAALYWMDPAHQDQPLAGWMTPRYVGQSYHLPRDVVADALMITRGEDPPRMRLSDIATQNDMTLDDLQSRIDAAKTAFEEDRQNRQGQTDG